MRERAVRSMGVRDCICAVDTMLCTVGSGQSESDVERSVDLKLFFVSLSCCLDVGGFGPSGVYFLFGM